MKRTGKQGRKRLSDDELLDKVQRETLKYFTDYAHPDSGMARERSNHSPQYDHDKTVTTGGTGFGVMAMLAGVKRGFLTREDAYARIEKIVAFLETADRFHGVYPHFLDGETGKTVPFEKNEDNGGDLVETSFLMMGLLTARQYFDGKDEKDLRDRINTLWEGVEWDWHTKGRDDTLLWHWSPDQGFVMNHSLEG